MRIAIVNIAILSFLMISSSYIGVRLADKDSYCLTMPRQDLDYTRENSKTFGDINVP